jgi:hypothetical protein
MLELRGNRKRERHNLSTVRRVGMAFAPNCALVALCIAPSPSEMEGFFVVAVEQIRNPIFATRMQPDTP